MDAIRRIRSLVLVLLLLCGAVPVQATDSTTFSIASGVSSEDEAYIREGVRLAEDYIWTTFDDAIRDPLIVNARDADYAANPSIVGMSGGDYIVVFTGSEGWHSSSPFNRVHVVVHEYVHVFEFDVEDSQNQTLPTWLMEGFAEYLGYDALAAHDLVSMADVDAYNAWSLVNSPPLDALVDYESLEHYQRANAAVYNLAYLATRRLLTEQGARAASTFVREVEGGTTWKDAFADAFGRDVESFYDSFETWREDLIAPDHVPQVFVPVITSTKPSPVRLTSPDAPLVAGEQAVILARATKGAVCSFGLRTDAGTTLAQSTFADATGHLFWLVTIPEDTRPGDATLTVRCGASPATVSVTIDPPA